LKKREERGEQEGALHFFYHGGEGRDDRKSSVLRVPRQFPLVHLVKVGWRQSRALGSEVVGLFGCAAG